MFRSIITIAAVAGLVAGASAQQQMPAGSLQKVTNLSYGSYDFNNGFSVNGGSNRASGPDVLFTNIPCPAYYYGIAGIPFFKQEWVDEGGLVVRGNSGGEEINGMYWEYCNGELLGYFDAVVSIYDDTAPFVGPSVWVPLTPSFADCLYLVAGLPDGGCWGITIDLSGGAECLVPQNAAGTYFGWSVTPYTSAVFHGPILGVQSCTGNGTEDLFEMRDWNGAFVGTVYTYVGTFWFGGGAKARADFRVEFSGSPEDVEGRYGTGSNDTLVLQALNNAEPASVWSLTVAGADATLNSYMLLISTGAATNTAMTNGFGTWTRQITLTPVVASPFSATGPAFGLSLSIPGTAPANALATAQVVELTGPASPASVSQAANGLEFYL
jgi:hypothetical protein